MNVNWNNTNKSAIQDKFYERFKKKEKEKENFYVLSVFYFWLWQSRNVDKNKRWRGIKFSVKCNSTKNECDNT